MLVQLFTTEPNTIPSGQATSGTLTPSLPWCHWETTHKSSKFQTLKPFRLICCTGVWKDLHQKHWKQMLYFYRTGKYIVCRHVRGSFSPEILQFGAVKGLTKWYVYKRSSYNKWCFFRLTWNTEYRPVCTLLTPLLPPSPTCWMNDWKMWTFNCKQV